MNNLKTGLMSLIYILMFHQFAFARQIKPTEKQLLTKVLTELTAQYKVNFLYEEVNLKQKTVTFNAIDFKGKPISEVLNSLLLPLNLSWYKVDARNYSIFLTPKKLDSKDKGKGMRSSLPDSSKLEKVTGSIVDENGKPLEYTTVTLLVALDSAFVSNALTDLSGIFAFPSVKPGTYKIKVSSMGHQPYLSKAFKVGDGAPTAAIEPIAMKVSDKTLKEVQVTATKALVETKSDRLIFNVDNSAMAVGNSLQVLKSAPFVRVSTENVLTLQGKKTMVLIDNKPVPDASLENILLTMPAGNISKVELITQPSAKYDASYGAVINIITKKSQVEGITGNLRLDGSSGNYANGSVNAGATYKHKNLTIYANGGINKGDNYYSIESKRFQDPTDPSYFLTNNWTRLSHNLMYTFQTNMELQLDKNQTVGLFVDLSDVEFKGPWKTTNSFGRENGKIDSVLFTDASFNQKGQSQTYNLNYRLLSDSGKNELTVLGTFTPWQRNLLQTFPSTLYNGDGEIIKNPPLYQTRNRGNIDVYIAQIDYTHLFKKEWSLETGLKHQQTNSKTLVVYEDYKTGELKEDPAFSNDNNLKESISGLYGILSKDWENDKVQVGFRAEATNVNSVANFKQRKFNFFPTLMYQHNINKDLNVSASYKKIINRPRYTEMVPYSVFLNQYSIEQGNPELKPQFDNVYTFTANIKRLNVSLSYTDTKGMIGLFPSQQDYSTKVTYFKRQNLKKASSLALNIFFPYRINEWWETMNSGTPIGRNSAEGVVLGADHKLSAFYSDFRTAHIFKITKDIKLQIDGYYWTKYTQDLGRYEGNKNIDASLMVNLWKGSGQFRLGGSELVFKRNDYLLERDYGTFKSAERIHTDSRRLLIGFNYKFGKSRIAKPDSKLGNADAMKRL
ncbi:outer membrane beta-barrel family protein [Pedobacter gandavensis]|uniref:Outer membrane beta-barrel protein n=1 Tax=Pedobacter gandavensis TaxID=2679963 RepID=A0ABR6ERL1_9SPHI|nr:outer membrane beta-barrel family protein [Pedobacter gandavensis]MBB2147895.1 outer membrane beta-barrel protein [Pedobacter gandavensis]